jgi:hypothetical protein
MGKAWSLPVNSSTMHVICEVAVAPTAVPVMVGFASPPMAIFQK